MVMSHPFLLLNDPWFDQRTTALFVFERVPNAGSPTHHEEHSLVPRWGPLHLAVASDSHSPAVSMLTYWTLRVLKSRDSRPEISSVSGLFGLFSMHLLSQVTLY